jgi:hypothetical protein
LYASPSTKLARPIDGACILRGHNFLFEELAALVWREICMAVNSLSPIGAGSLGQLTATMTTVRYEQPPDADIDDVLAVRAACPIPAALQRPRLGALLNRLMLQFSNYDLCPNSG